MGVPHRPRHRAAVDVRTEHDLRTPRHRAYCCNPNDPSRDQDCAERVQCRDAGKPGHDGCGLCPHDRPKHRPCTRCSTRT